MIRLLLLLFFFSPAVILKTEAQKDTLRKPVTNELNSSERNWLNTNYKKLSLLGKDKGIELIRFNFEAISEASLEYMISTAAKMLKADNDRKLALLQKILDQLKQQKQALQKKIKEKEDLLGKEMDAGKRKETEKSKLELLRQLRQVDDDISNKEKEIERRRSN